jgi:hypothetical protein
MVMVVPDGRMKKVAGVGRLARSTRAPLSRDRRTRHITRPLDRSNPVHVRPTITWTNVSKNRLWQQG